MNYELAKKLKDSGFPQGIVNVVGSDGWSYYTPTLEEVIEACGDKFAHLEKGSNPNEWFCNWSASKGSTPLEAVCHLWLELNKK